MNFEGDHGWPQQSLHSLVRLGEKHEQLDKHRSEHRLANSRPGGLDWLRLRVVQRDLVSTVEEKLLNILPREHKMCCVERQDGRFGCEFLGVKYERRGLGVNDDVARYSWISKVVRSGSSNVTLAMLGCFM